MNQSTKKTKRDGGAVAVAYMFDAQLRRAVSLEEPKLARFGQYAPVRAFTGICRLPVQNEQAERDTRIYWIQPI
jgi:hypothetical protein